MAKTGHLVDGARAVQCSTVAGRYTWGVEAPGAEWDRRVIDNQQRVTVNLNAIVRARLSTAGVATLHAARHTVVVPKTLIEDGCVWRTELWQFMQVFGPGLHNGGDIPTIGNVIEIELTPAASARAREEDR